MAKAGIVYVGTTNGLFVLSDPGQTGRWRVAFHTQEGQTIRSLQIADAQHFTIWHSDNSAEQTTDGGMSWQSHILEAPEEMQRPGIVRLEGSPVVILAIQNSLITRSEDEGMTWQAVTVVPTAEGQISVLAPVSTHPDSAWAGSTQGEVFQTHNRGRSWELVRRLDAPVTCLAFARLA